MGDHHAPLSLLQAAARHGAYCWVERRLFQLTGAWSAGSGLRPALQVHLFEASAQHAAHAAEWYDRLPVLAVVDRDELVRPAGPVLDPLLARLAAGAPAAGGAGRPEGSPPPGGDDAPGGREDGVAFVAGLYRVVLPALLASYRRHATRLSPVADEPSLQALRRIVQAEVEELATATALLAEVEEGSAATEASIATLRRLLDGAGAAGPVDAGDLVPWSDGRCAW